MSTPGVPQWGCPWHGLVKGSRLALSNGTNMFFPQPGNDGSWELGSTALIQHPGAPEIERTSEEAAADAAAGRQWWNKAIIAGDTLHGRELGGWLYIDPDGAVWLVTTTLSSEHVAGGHCEVKLKRFGVLGGKPEEYTYLVAVPDMGQVSPAIDQSSGYLRVVRYHTNKVGSAAVFEVSAEFLPPFSGADQVSYWKWRPCGWVEIELSGRGADCVAVVQLLKNRAQTLGPAFYSPLTRTPEEWYLVEKSGEDTITLTKTPTLGPGVSGRTLVYHEIISGSEVSGYDAYVVGMFYDDAGIHELTLGSRAVTNYSSPPVTHSGETVFGRNDPVVGTWTSTTNFVTSQRFSYAIDGEEVCSYTYTATQTSSETGVLDGNNSLHTAEGTVVYSPGGTFPKGGTGPWLGQNGWGSLGGQYTSLFLAARTPSEIPRYMSGWGGADWDTRPGRFQTLTFFAYRHSNTVFGLCEQFHAQLPTTYETNYPADVATPAGKVTLTPFAGGVGPAPFVYGSWCPVTGQVVRSLEPVCWI